jgi:hypothetical protein
MSDFGTWDRSPIKPFQLTGSWMDDSAGRRRRLECSLVGQNLLHAHHAEFDVPATRKEAKRGIYGKLVWRF